MLLSRTIDYLRFPLIVAVVMIHARFSEIIVGGVDVSQSSVFASYIGVSDFFSDTLARVAVPLFFFISGFLFFYHARFSTSAYVKKLAKRVRTLFIPYLFWNLLWILIYAGSRSVLPGIGKIAADCSLADWMSLLIVHPINYQFWFIRDLMVVVLCAPLVYVLVKYVRSYGVIFLGALWYFDCWPSITGLSAVSFFFFSAGAWFSVHGKDFAKIVKSYFYVPALLYISLALVDVYSKGTSWNLYIHHAGILVGIVLIVSIVARGLDSGRFRVRPFLSQASFFLFAFHALPLALLRKFLVNMFHLQSELAFLFLYFLCPVLIIIIGLSGYYILDRLLPRFTSIITGGR